MTQSLNHLLNHPLITPTPQPAQPLRRFDQLALQGIYPSPDSGSIYETGEPMLGEIRLFGANFVPSNWALADGRLLPIAQNAALFSIFGTTYGGDGVTNRPA